VLAAVALSGLLGSMAVVVVDASPASDAVSRSGAAAAPVLLGAGSRPNIVVVMTDDMNASDLRWMPRTRRLIGRAGTTFADAVSPNPVCCPARAAFITGLESHNNGVWSNGPPDGGYRALNRQSRLPQWLKRAGYRTAFLGKHLNGYRADRLPRPERGWTFHDPLTTGIYSYRTFTSWNNGHPRTVVNGYVTRYLSERTRTVLRRFERRDQRPFFLWVAHVAPHSARRKECQRGCWRPPRPAGQDRGDFADTPAPSRSSPSFNRDGGEDKPYFLRDRGARDVNKVQRMFSRRIEALQSVDRSVAATIEQLRRLGELRRTLVVFFSDNGLLLGEHQYIGKRLPYEPSVRVPLLIRGPGVRRGARVEHLVTVPDLTRTIVRVAGAQPAYPLDGVSLHRVLARRGAPPSRAATIVQTGGAAPDVRAWLYRGYRDERYTYAMYPDDGSGFRYEELYDRRVDPSEIDNVVGDPAYLHVLRQVRGRAEALHDCTGSSCHPDWGPLPSPG
jgi:arylsulfatase A-like enzyme